MAFWAEMDEDWDDWEEDDQFYYEDNPQEAEDSDESDIMAYMANRNAGKAPAPQRVVYEEPKPQYRNREEIADIGADLYRDTLAQTSTKQTISDVKRQCNATGKKFEDQEFPAGDHSLCNDWAECGDYQTQDDWQEFSWKRVDEIYNHPIEVFNHIEPADILQGQLGDCYFLSVLSAMAEFPWRIEKLLETKEY